MIFYDKDLDNRTYAKPVVIDVGGQDYSSEEYYCLPVLYERSTSEINCLILQRMGRWQGEYSRIGIFSSSYKEDIEIMVQESKPYEFDPELYDSTSTIMII